VTGRPIKLHLQLNKQRVSRVVSRSCFFSPSAISIIRRQQSFGHKSRQRAGIISTLDTLPTYSNVRKSCLQIV